MGPQCHLGSPRIATEPSLSVCSQLYGSYYSGKCQICLQVTSQILSLQPHTGKKPDSDNRLISLTSKSVLPDAVRFLTSVWSVILVFDPQVQGGIKSEKILLGTHTHKQAHGEPSLFYCVRSRVKKLRKAFLYLYYTVPFRTRHSEILSSFCLCMCAELLFCFFIP